MDTSKVVKLVAGFLIVLVLAESSQAHRCNEDLCNRFGCVRIFEHRNHGGRHRCHYPRQDSCSNFGDEDSWGASSVDFNSGRCINLYSESNCGGQSVTIDAESDYYRDFSGINFEDMAQSLSACV